ncbi:MAG: DUF2971 domain-containing protein [Oscillospiraceae bacterium]|nr:DUF2971 domain-containing protein [Oscillospiraceae bacterium]
MADNVFYHYTDFQALDGILRCAQLRVNNVLRMNDSAEMRHFMVRLASAIVLRLKDGGDHAHAQTAAAFFQEELRKEYTAFAACFSFRRDDAAQWERYGNWGRGVCIAFQGDLLRQLAAGPLSLHTVFYADDMTGHPMVDRFCRLARRKDTLSAADPDIQAALRDAWACSVAFKHPSFSSEDEVRLVVAPFGQEGFDMKPCYHITRERIKKYYPLDLREMCRKAGASMEELVAEIIIGPESTQSQAMLQDYLRDQGLGALAPRVFLSDCPLRGMPK